MAKHLSRLLVALVSLLLVLVAAPALADPVGVGPSVPSGGVWPLRPVPEVVNGFDPPATRYSAGHRGVDLAASPGQAVYAAAPGRITYAGRIAGRGVVVVGHGATRTTYEPVEAVVRVGATVAAGERIGTLKGTGGHCWPASCLHWGLIAGETYLDPLRLVGAGPVRLLPLAGGSRSSPFVTALAARSAAATAASSVTPAALASSAALASPTFRRPV